MTETSLLMIEVVVTALVVVGAMLALVSGRIPRRGRAWLLAAGLGAGSLFAVGVASLAAADRAGAREVVAAKLPHPADATSGYVGSSACRSCHPAEHASWHASYHRTMTQIATPESVLADFDGVTLERFGDQPDDRVGEPAHLERRGDEFWVDVIDPDWEQMAFNAGHDPDSVTGGPRLETRVLMTTGSHHYQTYWIPSQYGNQLICFPFVWLREDARWVPREAAFLRPPDDPRLFQVWNDNCLHCHATYGDPGLEASTRDVRSTAAELGISCEACHGPGAAHAAANRQPVRRYRQHFSESPDETIIQPERLDPVRSTEVCGQCHSITMPLVTAYEQGDRFEPGERLADSRQIIRATDANLTTETERDQWAFQMAFIEQNDPRFFRDRFWPDGMPRISGREYNALLESPCYQSGELSCLSCHSMHDYTEADDQLRLGMRGNDACVQCHADVSEDLAAHTHHAPDTPGSACMNCHMPHTTTGLLKGIRAHQVDSPSVDVTVATGRPNACSLCHLDRSLAWVADQLESWYGTVTETSLSDRSTAAGVEWLLAGDAGQRAIAAWHAGWEPAQDASGTDWLAPFLAQLLDDPYAGVRRIAARSLHTVPGFEEIPYDFVGPRAERRAAVERTTAAWSSAPARHGDAAVLHLDDGRIDRAAFERLLGRRDDRPIALQE